MDLFGVEKKQAVFQLYASSKTPDPLHYAVTSFRWFPFVFISQSFLQSLLPSPKFSP